MKHKLEQYLQNKLPEAKVTVEEVSLLMRTQVYGTIEYCGHTWEKKAEEWFALDLDTWAFTHMRQAVANELSTIHIPDERASVRGFPRGFLSLIHGERVSGKTTLCLRTAAEVTKSGGRVLYVDLDETLSMDYAMSLGVEEDRFRIINPYSRTAAAVALLQAIKDGVDMVVFDSLGHLFPNETALPGRIWGDFLPTIQGRLDKGNTAFVVVAKEDSRGVKGGMIWRFYSALTMRFHDEEIDVLKNRWSL